MRCFMVTVGFCAVMALLCTTANGAVMPGASDETIAARVNGKPIYFREIKAPIVAVIAKYRKFGGTAGPETLKRVAREELAQLVRQELLAQAGEKIFEPAEIERMVNVRMENLSLPSPEAHGANTPALVQNRLTLRRQVLITEYLARRGLDNVQVPERELTDYYREHREQFREGESVKVSHILIALPKNARPEDLVQARKKADDLLDDLRKGKNFEEAARAHSNCSSASDGGNLGFISRNYMPREFENVAFRLKIGELSGVVSTRHGFHLIKAYDRKEARIPDYASVKGQIEKLLQKEAQARKVEEIAQQLRREAKIEIYLD